MFVVFISLYEYTSMCTVSTVSTSSGHTECMESTWRVFRESDVDVRGGVVLPHICGPKVHYKQHTYSI